MSKGALIYEGKGKQIYQTGDPDKHIVEFKDVATSYDGVERASFASKENHRNHISCILLRTVEENDVPTHFIRPEGPSGMLVRALSPFPIEVVCYNAATGSLVNRMELTEGALLPFTLVEFFIEGRGPSGPPIRLSNLKGLNTVSEGEAKIIQARALMANHILKSYLYEKGFILAELRLEFGRDREGTLRLGDEISPDTCRLWERADYEKIDKDRFRKEAGTDESSYKRVAKMLTD